MENDNNQRMKIIRQFRKARGRADAYKELKLAQQRVDAERDTKVKSDEERTQKLVDSFKPIADFWDAIKDLEADQPIEGIRSGQRRPMSAHRIAAGQPKSANTSISLMAGDGTEECSIAAEYDRYDGVVITLTEGTYLKTTITVERAISLLAERAVRYNVDFESLNPDLEEEQS